MKKKSILNWRLIALMTVVLSIAIYFTTAGGMGFYINGKPVASNQGQPFVQSGVTYVPLQASVKGMGGTYSYNSKTHTATIKTKGSKQAMTITNGQTVAKIGKTSVALRTKVVNKKVVNDYRKAQVIRNVFYIPVDFLQKQCKYPVTVKKSGNTTNVYMGAIPVVKANSTVTPKPVPTPTPTPAPSTLDKGAVINALGSNGFYKHSGTLATLNIYNPGGSGFTSVAVDLTKDSNMEIEIFDWVDAEVPETNMIPGKVKFALDKIIPSGSTNVFNIVSATAVSGTHKDLNKVFTYNGLKTKVTFNGGSRPSVNITFSK